jgi:hypothetical protein
MNKTTYTFYDILYLEIDKIKDRIHHTFPNNKILFITIEINQNNSSLGELKITFDKPLDDIKELELYNLLTFPII